MKLLKVSLAALILAVVVGVVPMAQAQFTIEVTAAGSSAQWQSMGIAAYNAIATANTAEKGHWTSNGNIVSLIDTRTTPNNVDEGTLWVVWSCTTTACTAGDVWMFNKVDSVVGDRCFFAVPKCTLTAPAANLSGSGSGKIASYLFKDDSADKALPSAIATLIEDGTPIGVAATDIRPEDGQFAMCRANSALGSGTYVAGGTTDGLDGLGYNTNNTTPGACVTGLSSTSPKAVGNPILSGIPGAATNDQANVVAFSVVPGGADPISGTTVPSYTVVNVGAAPVVILTARASATGLKSVTNVTPAQLQQVFSGSNCDATAFGVSGGLGLNIFLREPSSGTMNTAEATLFRGALNGSGTALGLSQETNVTGGTNNPLNGQAGTCTSASGTGARYRAIGTTEEVAGVQFSNSSSACEYTTCFTTQQDGIAYAFFSFGNVSKINDKAAYGYVTVNGVDPIFANYNASTTAASYDAAQPKGGELPGQPDLEALAKTNGYCSAATGYPCEENQIWTDGLSFPNLRNGAYPSWSLLRAIAATNGGQLTALNTLVGNAQKNVVNSVPDFIPYKAVTCVTGTASTDCPDGEVKDPGLLVERAHYLQYDGAGVSINALGGSSTGSSTIENFTKTGTGGFTENGGDVGGEAFTCATSTTCPNSATVTDTTGTYAHQSQQVLQGFNGGGFSVRP